MRIFLKIMYCLLIFYLYASVLIFFYVTYKGRVLEREPIYRRRFLNYFFLIGCLFGLTVFLEAGFERALFFIPDDWGFLDEKGDWTSTKFMISIGISLFASLKLLEHSHKIFSKKKKK